MWSSVADGLATMRGWTVGAWLVAKRAQYVVAIEMPAAHTNGSSTTPPLCCIPALASPFQRAKASNASKPALSASFAARKEFSHVGRYASGAIVCMEPTVLVAKVPSFSLFLLKRGFRAWPGVVTKLILERDKFAVAQPVPDLGGPWISHPARERGSRPSPRDARSPSPAFSRGFTRL